MVKLKPEFIATKFPGYFFCTAATKLYSLKIDGVLKPLKFYKPNQFNHIGSHPLKLKSGERVYSKGGYNISVKGRRKFYPIEKLMELEEHDATIPVKEA